MRDHKDISPQVDYTNKSLTLTRTPVPKITKRKRPVPKTPKTPKIPKIPTSGRKKAKTDTPVIHDNSVSSDNYDGAPKVVSFSFPFVTDRTETGEKGEIDSDTTIPQE